MDILPARDEDYTGPRRYDRHSEKRVIEGLEAARPPASTKQQLATRARCDMTLKVARTENTMGQGGKAGPVNAKDRRRRNTS